MRWLARIALTIVSRWENKLWRYLYMRKGKRNGR